MGTFSALEQRLTDDLAKAEAELRETELSASRLRWQIQYIQTLLAGASPAAPSNGDRQQHVALPDPPLPAAEGMSKPYAGMTLPQAARTVLLDAGKPLRWRDVAQRLIEGGYGYGHIDIHRLVPQLTSMVGKDRARQLRRFVNVGGRLYDVAERHPSARAE